MGLDPLGMVSLNKKNVKNRLPLYRLYNIMKKQRLLIVQNTCFWCKAESQFIRVMMGRQYMKAIHISSH